MAKELRIDRTEKITAMRYDEGLKPVKYLL